jgi:hypothetical protein
MASDIEPKRRVSSVCNTPRDDAFVLGNVIARRDHAVPGGDSRSAGKKQRF